MENKITITATKLAVMYSEPQDIPARYKDDGKKKKIPGAKSVKMEERWAIQVDGWKATIETLLGKIQPAQAWRFIEADPNVEPGIKSVVQCQDFLDFTDFFILRRDIENCAATELGNIALLHFAFQKAIEQKINPGTIAS